jgi:MerR family transcriptional regulator, repressor of the yfmOP operon
MTAVSPERTFRIGELARLAGTTARTVRYYEEIGLLAEAGEREAGAHRTYSEADLERLRQVLRLKELLGLSLEELKRVVEAEEARAALRREWHETEDPATRRRIVDEALGHVGGQLELVRRRRAELADLEEELVARRARLRDARRDLEGA